MIKMNDCGNSLQTLPEVRGNETILKSDSWGF